MKKNYNRVDIIAAIVAWEFFMEMEADLARNDPDPDDAE
jgi:hypothetical protein